MESGNREPPIGEARHQALLREAVPHVYRSFADGLELRAYCYGAASGRESGRTGIIFCHSGLFDAGHPSQFVPHALHFAARGCFTATIEYRLLGATAASPVDAINDAQTAVLWMKKNAGFFAVDPDKLVIAGGAAGALLALSSALLPEGPAEGTIDCRPAAVGAFSGLYDTRPRKGVASDCFAEPADAVDFSPSKWVRKGLVPLFMTHGKKDRLIPHGQAKRFARAYARKKNQVDFIDFDGAEHSFYNFNVSEKHFEVTLDAFDAFLVRHGFLEPDVVV